MLDAILEPQNVLDSVIDEIDKIEHLTQELDVTLSPFFEPYIHVTPKRIDPSELGFVRLLSWFYIMLKETGKPNVEFWGKQLGLVSPDHMPNIGFYGVVNDLRTLMQHHVPQQPKLDKCQRWFMESCGKEHPDFEEIDWMKCLAILLRQGEDFLRSIRISLESLRIDEFKDVVLEQWREYRSKIRQPGRLDQVLLTVTREIGGDVDIGNYRKKNENNWLERISRKVSSPNDVNFEVEARHVIERHLLVESIGNLPITAEDLLEEFDVAPGVQIGELMREALGHFILGVNSKAALLDKLRKDRNTV